MKRGPYFTWMEVGGVERDKEKGWRWRRGGGKEVQEEEERWRRRRREGGGSETI